MPGKIMWPCWREVAYTRHSWREVAQNWGHSSIPPRHKREIQRRMDPRTHEDFQILYKELEMWRLKETRRIKTDFADNPEAQHDALKQLLNKVEGVMARGDTSTEPSLSCQDRRQLNPGGEKMIPCPQF